MQPTILMLGALVAACVGQSTMKPQEAARPREFGAVRWQRTLEPALEAAATGSKPVLLLFQEVPG